MQIYKDIREFGNLSCALTIGSFDGVHRGHCALLNELKQEAQKRSLPPTVLTFRQHPREILQPEKDFSQINTLDEKIELLERNGAENLIIIDFSHEFSQLTAKEFVEKVLLEKLHVKFLLLGYNHRFGSDNLEYADYEKMLKDAGIESKRAEKFLYDNTINCSSSETRKALLDGNVILSNKILGYEYFLTGKIVHGDAIGRQIGYPTANLKVKNSKKIIPRDGVYAAKVEIENQGYQGVVNIGFRPTISGNERRVEVHVIDCKSDLYDKEMTIKFVGRIRDEMRFENLEKLKSKIEEDIQLGKKMLLNVKI